MSYPPTISFPWASPPAITGGVNIALLRVTSRRACKRGAYKQGNGAKMDKYWPQGVLCDGNAMARRRVIRSGPLCIFQVLGYQLQLTPNKPKPAVSTRIYVPQNTKILFMAHLLLSWLMGPSLFPTPCPKSVRQPA